MDDRIERIEAFVVTIPRDTPYLGPLGAGEQVNTRGYFVRKSNRTIYPTQDRSVVVRVTTRNGVVGWGETYGLTAPKVIGTFIDDLIAPIVTGRDPFDVAVLWEDLYDILRVRGYGGGFYLDAVAAVDIALWDICGRIAGLPIRKLLGGERRQSIPAYISGLPRATLDERVALAKNFADQGFTAFKIAAAVSWDGLDRELGALREALGPEARLMVDFHWMHGRGDAAQLIRRLERHDLAFAEAPLKTEDVAGLAYVARSVTTPIAAGEEWRTVYDAEPRLTAGAVAIVQPEMGHTGITQFMRIAQLASAHHIPTIPHATIGTGIFLAASLQASAAILDLPMHEYQHSIFDRNAALLDGALACEAGAYRLPEGPGLGVAPGEGLWSYAEAI
ncbi:mandelate racemase/muconate lactonizing enzyme family protein [Sphingomonas sp. BT-65]|uniref:mandelate racemase/muconate lactonizing enzyme family protein n=1 Tax=Sphingomonas sp. BT-65 TaxID=2989821 RepID=UPI0022359BD9|nr:mandelate racemase/muconate lactonizing enzyme family protein [Sphingomonas sp. BT-65]MCW4461194.1 mandelate racemase/muconate lactonizing enzyme family protein [Sphingomonas sp. BT-65]